MLKFLLNGKTLLAKYWINTKFITWSNFLSSSEVGVCASMHHTRPLRKYFTARHVYVGHVTLRDTAELSWSRVIGHVIHFRNEKSLPSYRFHSSDQTSNLTLRHALTIFMIIFSFPSVFSVEIHWSHLRGDTHLSVLKVHVINIFMSAHMVQEGRC